MKRMTLTRRALSLALAEKQGLHQLDAAEIVEAVFSVMKDAMVAGESVKLVQFGILLVLDKASRCGRNPRTGEEMLISRRRMVSFRPSKRLRDRINQAD